MYTLRVEAEDGKSNPSGSTPYEIQFRVESESTLTITDPYPNPFVTAIYFKVVITGNEVPDAFDMQIISTNGKQVAHYADYSTSAFHIGTNMVSWDGNDSRGNKLPDGVYIYKMMVYLKEKVVQKIGKVVLVQSP